MPDVQAPEDTALWRRICQLATDQPNVQPDMEPEHFVRILSAERTPRPLEFAAICEAFGVTDAWLLTGDDHGLCDETHAALRKDIEAGRPEITEWKKALNRLRIQHANCPGAHDILDTFHSEADGCDMVVCACGWVYDAEEQCPGVGEIND